MEAFDTCPSSGQSTSRYLMVAAETSATLGCNIRQIGALFNHRTTPTNNN
jgi:hypothetical protein